MDMEGSESAGSQEALSTVQLPTPSSEARRSNLPPSSPPRRNGRKEKRDPSVTPRKFRKFFTPRSRDELLTPRHALGEMTGPRLNRYSTRSTSSTAARHDNEERSGTSDFPRGMKRRKLFHTPEPTPEGTQSKGHGFGELQHGEDKVDNIQSSPCERAYKDFGNIIEEDQEQNLPPKPLKPIVPIFRRGLGGQLLDRSYGSYRRPGRQHVTYPVPDWREDTANFYSGPEDMHLNLSLENPDAVNAERTIPFCVTGLNTNSLVAVGDEEGRIRLLDPSKPPPKSSFSRPFLSFRAHANAIIDMHFTDDDSLVATASGDQSARVLDMKTQTTIAILGIHTASLKQVRFQPGANNQSVLATSSRDGSIQIWDIRCNGMNGPVHRIYSPVDAIRTRGDVRKINYGRPVNSVFDAHKALNRQQPGPRNTDSGTRGESTGRLGEISVTALQFLPAGLDHLLISASEATASVKLWDIRSLQNKRSAALPLSSTQYPQSHSKWRHFGINSMNLSGDGSRLYTLCKDNTVYAYSTAHLMLGHVPELSTNNTTRPAQQQTSGEGLGPMYGFRHPKLHATSFYVKSSVRPAKDGKCEMLAVGSSDNCVVLFPTDERYIPRELLPEASDDPASRSYLRRRTLRGLSTGKSARVDASIPISTNGTALIHGHNREVASVSWNYDGKLISAGDDYIVRCWQEGPKAKDLRVNGHKEGRQWGCGWADMGEGGEYDADEVSDGEALTAEDRECIRKYEAKH